jgi:hypothetical protein
VLPLPPFTLFLLNQLLFQLPVKLLEFLLGKFIVGHCVTVPLSVLFILLLCFDICNFKLGDGLEESALKRFWI